MIPLRISALNSLTKCPGFAALGTIDDSPGGIAANSGSAVGRVVQLWHERGEDPIALDAAIRQAEAEIARHPKADFDDVRKWAEGYARDPRNAGVVEPASCEREVKLRLGAFELVGHVDQLRRQHGALSVWDLKSGKPGGRDMVNSHAWQISAYALACTETLGETVLPGGIIRIRSYAWNNRCRWDKSDMANAPAFYATPWSLDVCREMMASVESHLSMLAEGRVHMHPGTQCAWCPGAAPNLCGDAISDAFEGSA